MTPVALTCIGRVATNDQISAATTADEIAHSAHHPWALVVLMISSRASGLELLGRGGAGGCDGVEVCELMNPSLP